MDWQPLPLDGDPDVVIARILDRLQVSLGSSWTAREGAPEVALAEEFGTEIAATNAGVASAGAVATAGFGVSVMGLATITGAVSQISVTLTMTATGAVAPAGMLVVGRSANGVDVAFVLPADATATTGSTVSVVLYARDVGVAGNGVPAGPLTLVTTTATVISATATAASFGGVDAETLEEYLGRLVDYQSVLRPGGVRASDIVRLARNTAGVQRALALDNYDATTSTSGVARTVSVFPVDATGAPVDAATKAALMAALSATREVNFVFRVADPAYTALMITFTAVAETGQAVATVQANIIAAIAAFLSPAAWGASSDAQTDWAAKPVVRYLELARVAGSAAGVGYLTALTVNGGTSDVTLSGVAALPKPTTGSSPTTITGTVS